LQRRLHSYFVIGLKFRKISASCLDYTFEGCMVIYYVNVNYRKHRCFNRPQGRYCEMKTIFPADMEETQIRSFTETGHKPINHRLEKTTITVAFADDRHVVK